MCRRVNCNKCNKPTFAGCGMHIEQVLGDVPRDQRCACKADSQSAKPQDSKRGGWWPFG